MNSKIISELEKIQMILRQAQNLSLPFVQIEITDERIDAVNQAIDKLRSIDDIKSVSMDAASMSNTIIISTPSISGIKPDKIRIPGAAGIPDIEVESPIDNGCEKAPHKVRDDKKERRYEDDDLS